MGSGVTLLLAGNVNLGGREKGGSRHCGRTEDGQAERPSLRMVMHDRFSPQGTGRRGLGLVAEGLVRQRARGKRSCLYYLGLTSRPGPCCFSQVRLLQHLLPRTVAAVSRLLQTYRLWRKFSGDVTGPLATRVPMKGVPCWSPPAPRLRNQVLLYTHRRGACCHAGPRESPCRAGDAFFMSYRKQTNKQTKARIYLCCQGIFIFEEKLAFSK